MRSAMRLQCSTTSDAGYEPSGSAMFSDASGRKSAMTAMEK